MFRFNNPDALLVLLMAARRLGHDARPRARRSAEVVHGRRRLVGLGFLTKTLQALLVVPAFAPGVPGCSPTPRCAGASPAALVGGAAMVASRRLVGGRRRARAREHAALHRRLPGQLFLELTFGYNGLGRINGDETGASAVGGGGRLGRHRHRPDVQRRHRRPDLLAHPGRPDPARRRALPARPGAAHRPAPRGIRGVGRLAARHRADLLA